MSYQEITACRLCGSQDLEEVWDLGEQWVMDCLKEGQEGFKAPLVVVLCRGCCLAQLKHTVNRDLLYRKYFYRSGTSETMREALQEVADASQKQVLLKPHDIVLDIGSNDSFLLHQFTSGKLTLVGFEPAENIVETIGRTRKSVGDWNYIEGSGGPEHTVITDYFTRAGFQRYFMNRQAAIVTSVAMFYDVDNPNQFINDVAQLLALDGVWINQMNFVGPVMRSNAFDFISHEHVALWDLWTFEKAVLQAGLEVFDLQELPLNGGTYRVYIGHKGHRPITSRVFECLSKDGGFGSADAWRAFKTRVEMNGMRLRRVLADIQAQGKTVAVLGASTRGNSLLQAYNLSVAVLPYASDRDPHKFGKKMAGTKIPIVSEEEARQRRPDYFLVLPYSYIDQIRARETDFLSRGGRFIVPLPQAKILEA